MGFVDGLGGAASTLVQRDHLAAASLRGPVIASAADPVIASAAKQSPSLRGPVIARTRHCADLSLRAQRSNPKARTAGSEPAMFAVEEIASSVCFVASLLAMTEGLLRCARNDGGIASRHVALLLAAKGRSQ
jgi:hypothetical protein